MLLNTRRHFCRTVSSSRLSWVVPPSAHHERRHVHLVTLISPVDLVEGATYRSLRYPRLRMEGALLGLHLAVQPHGHDSKSQRPQSRKAYGLLVGRSQWNGSILVVATITGRAGLLLTYLSDGHSVPA